MTVFEVCPPAVGQRRLGGTDSRYAVAGSVTDVKIPAMKRSTPKAGSPTHAGLTVRFGEIVHAGTTFRPKGLFAERQRGIRLGNSRAHASPYTSAFLRRLIAMASAKVARQVYRRINGFSPEAGRKRAAKSVIRREAAT